MVRLEHCADYTAGVQSQAREHILGRPFPPVDTGDIVYRILIPGSVVLDDPELFELVSQPWVSSWCGPGAHVIGYPVRGGEVYNVVFCCDASSLQDEPMQEGETKQIINDNSELVRRFAEWCPQVRKLVSYTSKVGLPPINACQYQGHLLSPSVVLFEMGPLRFRHCRAMGSPKRQSDIARGCVPPNASIHGFRGSYGV